MAKNPWVLPEGFDSGSAAAIKAILKALRNSGKQIPDAAYSALQIGDISGFLEFVNWKEIRESFGDLSSIMESMASNAGKSTYTLGGVEAQLMFDLIDARAVDYAQERVGALIVEISEQMRETVRDVIARASAGEMTYQQAAIRLQSTIGLTTRDAGAVDKYIEKQFQRFMRNGLSEAKARVKAQNMGGKYAAKLLDSRSRTIARTEIADAAMNGRYLGWDAGVTAGYIAADSVKEWIAEPNACPICAALDGTLIGWNDEWTFPEGVSAGTNNRMPPAHPNCRCSVAILPPDYADSVFTPSSGGEMPKAADEFTKHLAGQHDQSTHGRGKSAKYDISGYEGLVGGSSEDFQSALSGLGISPEVAMGSEARFSFRSQPAPKEFQGNFDALDKAVSQLTQNSPVSIMTEESVIENILEDGEVKSIFEVGEWAKGEQYLEHRTAYEKIAFGYDNDTPVEMRPISGIIYPAQHNNDLIDTFGTNYGSVQIVLKDEAKERTTFTVGDSLDKWQRPTPIGGKVPRTFDLATKAQGAAQGFKNDKNMLEDKGWWNFNYVEAQVHGGVKLKDIEKIVFHYPENVDMEFMEFRLGELGIPFEVVG